MNVVVLKGTLAEPPRVQRLTTGEHLYSFLLNVVNTVENLSEAVPVYWEPGVSALPTLETGRELVVVGRVRRRFVRHGRSGAASRTEVVASEVLPVTLDAAIRAVIDEATRRVQDEFGPAG